MAAGLAILVMAPAAKAVSPARQPSPPRHVRAHAPRIVGFNASAHPTRGGGALITWHTTSERATVGFTVLRSTGIHRPAVALNARLVAGSLLRVGTERLSATPRTYRYFDRAGRRGDRYWIRQVSSDGQSHLYGPYTVRGNLVRREPTSPLLAPTKPKPTGSGPTTSGPTQPVTVAPVAPVIPPNAPPTTVEGALAASQTVQLGVTQTGWYRVPLTILENAGVNTSTPEDIHVFTGGQEIATSIVNGGLEFYGQALTTIDTATRVYTVQAESGPGLQISTATTDPSAPAGPPAFATSVTRSDHTIYDATALPDASSNFFGNPITSTTSSETIAVPDVADASNATLAVSLQGVTTNDHAVTVALDGTTLGTVTWSGATTGTATFPASMITSGTNTVSFTATTSGDVDLTGPVTISYQHGMAADADQLTATLPGDRTISMGGFSAPGQVRVYDVSDPADPVSLPVQPSSTGISFTPQGGGGAVYAFDPDDVLSPASVTPSMPSSWNTPNNSGALTIITTPALAPALAPLVARREAQGMSVAVVDIEDIENEFTFGEDDHSAITDFLDYARANWQVPPQYVLLAGDGTYDPLGYLGNDSAANVLPVDLINTSTVQTASDTTLTGTFDTGRFPAQTESQLAGMVSKDLLYEDATPTDSATLVSDVSTTWDFNGAANSLEPLLPANWSYARIDRGSQSDARSLLLSALNTGPSVVNYSGHGSTTFWGGNLLTAADAAGLTNTAHPSLYIMMTCLNAYFISPTTDSLAEALLKAPGGASAVFSSTGEAAPGPEDQANQAVFSALFSSGQPVRLGDAIAAGLSAAGDNDAGTTFTLLGDPTEIVP